MNSYDFADRVAIITGGGQGIGYTVAQRILASGGRVCIWDVDETLLETLPSALNATGDRLLAQKIDISDLGSVEKGVSNVISTFGTIDVLINNAAIVGPNAPTWEYPPDAFESVVRIGLLGTFNVCRAVVPHMIKANYGRIVNVSSVAGKEGSIRRCVVFFCESH